MADDGGSVAECKVRGVGGQGGGEGGDMRWFNEELVKSEGMEKMVKELMEGEMGKEARREAKELAVVVRKAVSEGGSSWSTLQLLIDETTCDKNTS
ncbi:hypothetical protein ACFX2A_023958 [Malus domestica]